MDGQQAQYIPFAVGLYLESNMWSWKPYRKETLYGRIIFTGRQNHYGFRDPEWVVGADGIVDGLLFHKLLKQILYFPNCVVSLPSLLLDNALFVLYLKYMMTRFDAAKLFCLSVRSVEEEVAKHHGFRDCIVVLNEHRSFSVCVIAHGQRLKQREMMRKFLGTKTVMNEEDQVMIPNLFPRGFFHYRDDFDDSFYVTNVSNFDLVGSVRDEASISKLAATASEQDQKAEALPPIGPYSWRSRSRMNWKNQSSTAPEPVVMDREVSAYFVTFRFEAMGF